MKNVVMATRYKIGDRVRFANMCRTWESLNVGICTLDVDGLIRLIRYLIETRPGNVTYLKRVVSRFNAMNKLTVEDLRHERNSDTKTFTIHGARIGRTGA